MCTRYEQLRPMKNEQNIPSTLSNVKGRLSAINEARRELLIVLKKIACKLLKKISSKKDIGVRIPEWRAREREEVREYLNKWSNMVFYLHDKSVYTYYKLYL